MISSLQPVGTPFSVSINDPDNISFEIDNIADASLSQTVPTNPKPLLRDKFILFNDKFDDHMMVDLTVKYIKRFVANTFFTVNTQNEFGRYQGSVKDGKPLVGTMTVPLGEYTGEFVDGLPQGSSGVMKTYGSTIWSSFYKGFPHGEGRANILNYATLKSKLKFSFFDPGEMAKLPQQDIFEGMFDMGKYHGLGKYNWAEGDTYHGNWTYGKRDGFGVHKLENGDVYIGGWKNREMHGQWKYIFASGKVKEGVCEDDTRQ